MIRELTSAVFVLVLAVPVAGCRQAPPAATAAVVDNQAQQACDTLAAGYPKSSTAGKRLNLADDVFRWSGRSDNPAIVKQGSVVGKAANDSTEAWDRAAADFLQICRRAGWVKK
ncbi:hypothetical protein GCM10010172_78380 [Paractinoplanes ferrugineus]|uniref:Uncharacterized protein n=1 Tax=Paractinoplanes ferrugineus TaxID=113564 RepID=A0A919J199_9ACTN|nr:hypothetical protein [Actinoplanes ferrugineus]GIE12911.1 hypothetical protein Afe05nite_47510 [Actinoplanes ferrugineus]